MATWLVTRAALASLLITSIMLGAPLPTSAQDACPEPNDGLQGACHISAGSTIEGVLSTAEDIDSYALDVLDFNATLQVTLTNPAAPYRLSVARWDGTVVATSGGSGTQAALSAPIGPPGTYYVMVDSATGQVNASAPYRLSTQIRYPVAPEPRPYLSEDFRSGSDDEVDQRDDVDFIQGQGRRTIALKKEGARNSPLVRSWYVGGSLAAAFSVAVDTRVVAGSSVGHVLYFGERDENNFHYVMVDDEEHKVLLAKVVDGKYTPIADWVENGSISTDGINRTVVLSNGSEIIVNVNGTEVARVGGQRVPAGRFRIGAATWAEPATVNFDNLVIAVPGVRGAPNARVVTDDFSDVRGGALTIRSGNPDAYSLSYQDGEYVIKTAAGAPDKVWNVFLPFVYGGSSIEVDARSIGAPQQIVLACRTTKQADGSDSGYRVDFLTNSGQFLVSRVDNGVFATLVDRSGIPAVRMGRENANRFEFSCVGSTITVKANGAEIARVQDDTYKQGQSWIAGGPVQGGLASETRFDNLVVTQR
ncbi:MAG: hypothetical protein U0821_22365 [Chloroflexota bacterium]